jgi:hypothetical protein
MLFGVQGKALLEASAARRRALPGQVVDAVPSGPIMC